MNNDFRLYCQVFASSLVAHLDKNRAHITSAPQYYCQSINSKRCYASLKNSIRNSWKNTNSGDPKQRLHISGCGEEERMFIRTI